MNLTLTTVSGPVATTGALWVDSAMYYTVEQPWNNNHPDTSCVPAGMFDLIPYVSPTHGPTYCLRNPDLKIMGCDELTPDQIAAGYRNYCELHSANWASQLKGCIAPGTNCQPMLNPDTGNIEPAVEHSVNAISAIMAVLGFQPGHTLTIARS